MRHLRAPGCASRGRDRASWPDVRVHGRGPPPPAPPFRPRRFPARPAAGHRLGARRAGYPGGAAPAAGNRSASRCRRWSRAASRSSSPRSSRSCRIRSRPRPPGAFGGRAAQRGGRRGAGSHLARARRWFPPAALRLARAAHPARARAPGPGHSPRAPRRRRGPLPRRVGARFPAELPGSWVPRGTGSAVRRRSPSPGSATPEVPPGHRPRAALPAPAVAMSISAPSIGANLWFGVVPVATSGARLGALMACCATMTGW